MYYFIIWFVIAICTVVNYFSQSRKNDLITYTICYLSLALTSGLRYETGIDYFAYLNIFEGSQNIMEFNFFASYVEPSYAFLNSLFYSLGFDINIMYLTISLITTAILLNSFKRYIGQKYYLLAVIIYYSVSYFLLDMSGVRQAIALSAFVYSIRFIIERRFWKFFFVIVIAFTFHRSAAILLVVYPISRMHIASWLHITILLLGIFLMIAKITLLRPILEFGSSIFLSGPLASKFLAFTTSEFFAVPRTLTVGLMIYVPIYVIAVVKRKRLERLVPYYNVILNIFLCFIVTLFSLYESMDISIRFSSYFTFAFALTFPLLLSLLKQDGKNLIIGFFVIFFVSVFAMRHMILDGEPTTIMYRPYQNYILHELGIQESDAEKRYQEIAK